MEVDLSDFMLVDVADFEGMAVKVLQECFNKDKLAQSKLNLDMIG